MATSGLLVFARGLEMQRHLSELFRERLVSKQYIAQVAGRIDSGEINLPLGADWPNRPRQKVDIESGKPSLTRYRLLSYCASTDTSFVALEPLTGRTHQLRVHLSAIGHPIIGDALYGGRPAGRLMLHAGMLAFAHPQSGCQLTCVCEPEF